jgi:hypothetical protein
MQGQAVPDCALRDQNMPVVDQPQTMQIGVADALPDFLR